MTNDDRLISDAVHVRTWLLRLSEGRGIHIQPGSEDHAMLMNVVNHIEHRMKVSVSNAKAQKHRRTVLVSPTSIAVRKSRDRQRARFSSMVKKYFEIYPSEVKKK